MKAYETKEAATKAKSHRLDNVTFISQHYAAAMGVKSEGWYVTDAWNNLK